MSNPNTLKKFNQIPNDFIHKFYALSEDCVKSRVLFYYRGAYITEEQKNFRLVASFFEYPFIEGFQSERICIL